MSGLEPKEQWLCIPHSEQGGCPGIQTRREKTHKNDNKLRLDFSSPSILQRKKVLSVQEISSFSDVGCFFLLFMDWIGKFGAFVVWALANSLCFIDELHVSVIMHLKTSRSPKEMRIREVVCFETCKRILYPIYQNENKHNSADLFRSNPFCFYCRLQYCLLSFHFKSYSNFLSALQLFLKAIALSHTKWTVSLL